MSLDKRVLQRLEHDLISASDPADMGQEPVVYIRNDVFRTMASSLHALADSACPPDVPEPEPVPTPGDAQLRELVAQIASGDYDDHLLTLKRYIAQREQTRLYLSEVLEQEPRT